MTPQTACFFHCQPAGPDRFPLFDARLRARYLRHDGLSTQVRAGISEGLRKESSIHCDELVSLPKTALTHYVGCLRDSALSELDDALAIALGLETQSLPQAYR